MLLYSFKNSKTFLCKTQFNINKQIKRSTKFFSNSNKSKEIPPEIQKIEKEYLKLDFYSILNCKYNASEKEIKKIC